MELEQRNVSNITKLYPDYEFDYEEFYEDYRSKISKENGKIAYLSIIVIVSLIFNIILIIQQYLKIRKPKHGHSRSMPYMLVNFAVANLLSTVFSVLVRDVWLGLHWWYAGDFMCKLVLYFRSLEHFLRPFSAVGLLSAYIAERVTKQDGRRIALFFMIPACVLGGLLSCPSFFVFGTDKVVFADRYHCKHSRGSVMLALHALSVGIIGFLCPAVISACLCCASCNIDRKDKSQGEDNSISIRYKSTAEEVVHDQAPLDTGDSIPVGIKPSYLPLIINIVFFVMYLQFFVLTALTLFVHLGETSDHITWMYFTGTASVAVTAVIAVVGSLSKFPNFKSTNDFRFKTLMADIY